MERRAHQNLLVLTDAHCRGWHALALPFQQATIVEVNSGDRELNILGTFDTIAVDRRSLDLDWLDAVAEWARSVLRPDGRLVVALGTADDGASAPVKCASRHSRQASSFAGFEWRGLTALNGRPCAVLEPTDHPSQAPATVEALLTTADAAARIAAGGGHRTGRSTTIGHLKERRKLERLRQQVEALTKELEQVRREHQGLRLVRTVLRRSGPGRALLRVLRPGWRLARAIRSGIRNIRG